MKRILFKPRERKRERDPTALRSCQSKQFRVWRKRGKKRKSPPSALSPKRTKVFLGKRCPENLSLSEKSLRSEKAPLDSQKSIRISDLPLPGKQSERSKPAFSRKNRSKRKERFPPHSASLTDQLFFCARARERLFASNSPRGAISQKRERKNFQTTCSEGIRRKKKNDAYLLCLGSSLSRYRWCPKTPPLR